MGLILVAAGSGARLRADVPKAFVPLAGEPLLGHALRGARCCPGLVEIVVVAPPGWLGEAERVCRSLGDQPHAGSGGPDAAPGVGTVVVPGGAERSDSVAAGLTALGRGVEYVVVHDAARCLTPAAVFERVVDALRSGAPAVVPGIAVVDTIKQVDEAETVVATPDRARLRAVQTPQGFRADVLARAHAAAAAAAADATDDAALVERLGEPVRVVPGDPRAIKVTTHDDLQAAARILAG